RLVRQKTVTFFCAGGSFVKKQRLFSAPQARSSKNSDFFLRRRLVRQKTATFFCAGGSFVQKTVYFFLRRRLERQKTVTFFCAGSSFVKKQ
ncbi:hypothetical protein, partial [Segatella oulorum]|uniref:hypothetical protein n=1 Tax=Segatella oulorum TaxID=28136 RepID=UPI001E3C68E0